MNLRLLPAERWTGAAGSSADITRLNVFERRVT
jgi:hypothetical protein